MNRKGPAFLSAAESSSPDDHNISDRPQQANVTASELVLLTQERRIVHGTQVAYDHKIQNAITWFQRNNPRALRSRTADDGSNILEFKFPLNKKFILDFFGELTRFAHKRDMNIFDDREPYSITHLKGYRSAFVNLCSKNNTQLSADLDAGLNTLLDGYEKTINDLRKRGVMKIHEGKNPFTYIGYYLLAGKLLRKVLPRHGCGGWSASIFSWAFFTIMWNLMSRSDSVDTINLEHIKWSEDSLIIEEQGGKSDQTGEAKYGKHIYANPENPTVCPVLALAVLTFTRSFRENGGTQLFAGGNSKNRFSKILRDVFRSLTENEKHLLPLQADEVGTHSCRKGSSSYCLGQVAGPTPVSVFIRMNHSLGDVKDRYIHYGEGADQLCGRMVTGLCYTDDTFGILPPHFTDDVLNSLNVEDWGELIDGYIFLPTGFKSVLPFLLASVFFHEKFLRDTLDDNHPIFQAAVFSQNSKLELMRQSKPLTGIAVCPVTKLKATGIPPHCALYTAVTKMEKRLLELEKRIIDQEDKMQHDWPQHISAVICKDLTENFEVNGLNGINRMQLDISLKTLSEQIMEGVERLVQQCIGSSANNADENDISEDAFKWRAWPGSNGVIVRFVPPDWTFPKNIPLSMLWKLWHFGHKDMGIRPYKLLNMKVEAGNDYKLHVSNYNRAATIMRYLDEQLKNSDPPLLPHDFHSITQLKPSKAYKLFGKLYSQLLERINHTGKLDCNRDDEISYGTIYNLLLASDPLGEITRKRKRQPK